MASAKLVLLLMADQTTGDLAFLAVNTIARRTGLDRKTVMTSIARLIEWGLIEDTGERRGRTGSVPVYRLLTNEDLFDNEPYPKASSGTKTGTSTKTGTASEAVPKTDGSGTVFPTKQYQKRDTDTELLTQELDPSLSPCARATPTDHAHPEAAEAERSPHAVYPGFESERGEHALPDSASPGTLACIALRKAGMGATSLNPSHPTLLRALEAGVTPTELADVAREVLARGGAPPNLPYVCRTAAGRRRDEATRARGCTDASPTGQSSSRPSRPRGAPPSALQRVVAGIMSRGEADAGPAQATDAREPVG
jgi:hypothetical protein